jgi:HD-GYP domain-containing protein (c-di-GMP phosphodiesterase class II)
MAVADVYDALMDNRVYRKSMGHIQAFDIISGGKGTQFDPLIVAAFQSLDYDELTRQYQPIQNTENNPTEGK